MAAHLSLVDVVVDVGQVLGHLGVDAGPAGLSAAAPASVAHDAHLHEAAACGAQQGATVVPLRTQHILKADYVTLQRSLI